MLTLLLTLLMMVSCQSNQKVDTTDLLSNSWVLGIIAENNVVDKPRPSRGGWSTLTLDKDGMVNYADSFNCGMGMSKIGTWTLNDDKDELTFHFAELKGQITSNKDKVIDESRRFNILHLSQIALVLQPINVDNATNLGYLPKSGMVQ